MAFPAGLKVAGGALLGAAEGLQAIPAYIERDEELAERHEERLANRKLRPMTLEEARLRLEKSRRESLEPKPLSAGAHGSYVWNPETKHYEFDARSAALGGAGDTAAIRTFRTLHAMASDPNNPELARMAQGKLEQMSGIRTPAEVQMYRSYFEDLRNGREPDPAVVEFIRRKQLDFYKQSEAGAGYKPLDIPLPGLSGQSPPAASPAPAPGSAASSAPAPGSAAPPAGGTTRPAMPLSGSAGPSWELLSPLERKQADAYTQWFQSAGEDWSAKTIQSMFKSNHPNKRAAELGFTKAFTTGGSTAPQETAPAQLAPVTVTAQVPQPGQGGSGPTPAYIARTRAAENRAKGLPSWKPEQVAMAKRLHARGVIPSSDLFALSDEDFTKVTDYLDAGKQEPLFQKRVKEAESQIVALDAIEMAEKVSEDIYPLLNWKTVGIGGFLNNAWQTATSAIGAYKDPNDKKTLSQAVDGTRRVIELAKKRGDINQVLAENPRAAQDMMNPGAPTVRVLAAVLAYLHASAIKKGASAGSRGIAVQDIRLANELFDPVSILSNPSAIREKLVALQTSYLRPDKEVIEKALTLKGIDSKTRKPVKGFHFGELPGGDVAAPTPDEDIELLRSGGN